MRSPFPVPASDATVPAPLFFGDGLFSLHYLTERLPKSAFWADEAAASAALRDLRSEYARVKNALPAGNEEDVEDRLVAPILAALGFGWEKRRVMQTGGGGKGFPDFLLYATLADAQTAFHSKVFYPHCIGILEAKKWGVALQTPATVRTRSPHLQLRDYLNEHPAIGYGIVTNGGEWRLYARSAPASDFLAVDLARILDAPDDDGNASWAFRLFYTLFGRAAFVDGGRVLNEARSGAERFREEIEEQLRKQVFDAMESLARGFLANRDNNLTTGDLPAIYDNCLILLYRLLFVLNAEARDLLPTNTDSIYYKTCGLELVRQKLADGQAADEFSDTDTFALWGRMEGLFDLINGDNAARNERYNVPRYNGGLFDPARYPFLRKCRVGDVFLRDAIQTLTFRKDGANARSVTAFDYAGLGERHLGSIYEGLLEHVLRVDAAGQTVRLANDKGERKTQGAYYTPQPWVSYLVRAALSPLLETIEQSEAVRQNVPDSFAQAALALNVCDPAMGSGHFLVEATLFLANAVSAHSTTVTGDTAYWKRRVVEACIYGVDLNPLAVELAKLSLWLATVDRVPLNFLDHHLLCGNSLVGTTLGALPNFPDPKRKKVAGKKGAVMQLSLQFASDLNEAVQRAIAGIHEIEATSTDTHAVAKHKENLWRDLSQNVIPRFTRVADLWTAPYFGADFSFVAFANATDDSERGKAERQKYAPLLDALRPFHFEIAFPDVFFTERGTRKADAGFDAVIGNPPWERVKLAENEFFAARDPAIARAVRASDRKALIADLFKTNPDLWNEWTTARTRAENLAAFLQKSGFYPLMGVGDTNLYAVFVERATTIAAKRGRVALLVPSGIATDQTTSGFFRYIVENGRLSELLDFENRAGVFPDVHRSFKFSIVVFGGENETQTAARCGFFLHRIEDVQDARRVFDLTPTDFATFNPNTLTCPIFRTRQDADLTRALYQAAPILIRRAAPPLGLGAGNASGSAGNDSPRIANDSPRIANDSPRIANDFGSAGNASGSAGNDFGGPRNDSGSPQNDFAVPRNDGIVPRNDSGGLLQGGGGIRSDAGGLQNASGGIAQSAGGALLAPANPWGVRFLRMFDMTNDSARFKTYAELDALGFWEGAGRVMTKGAARYLPLYEGKMVQMYDHRAASVKINPANQFRKAQEEPTTDAEHGDPDFSPMPQYWVSEADVAARLGGASPPYLMGFKDITAPTNQRTVITSAIPFRAAGHKFPLYFVAPQWTDIAFCLMANLASLPLDYVARQKIGGQNLTYFYLEQFPVIAPEKYAEPLPGMAGGETIAEFVKARVLPLVYTARDMTPFARALGYAGEPFAWDAETRLRLRCELDALFFVLYNMNGADTEAILNTFPIVQKTDEARYNGKFRTRDLILNYRKAYAAGNWDARVAG